MKAEKVEAMREFILLLTKQVKDAQIEASISAMLDKLIAEKMAEIESAVLAQGVRVGHLQISRHPEYGIWLRHDNGEAMQTDEYKLYQHLSEYWHKEF